MEAKFVRDVSFNFMGEAHLYRLDPPLDGHEYVISSALNNWFAHETMVFPAYDSESVDVHDWTDLAVSYKADPKAPLEALGYIVIP